MKIKLKVSDKRLSKKQTSMINLKWIIAVIMYE